MLDLIKKELIVTRTYVILGIVIIFISGPLILLSVNDIGAYLMFIFLNLLIVIMTCNTEMILEIMEKPDMVMASLPLKRDNIVKSKYIVYGLYPFLSSIVLYLVTKFYEKNSFLGEISRGLGHMEKGIGVDVIMFSFAICLIYISISIPLHYLLGENSKIIGYVLFVLFFIISGQLFGPPETNAGSSIVDNILGIDIIVFSLLLLGLSLILYLASMKISIKIYNKKEI